MNHTYIPGKDEALEVSIAVMQKRLAELGFDIEEASWLNPVPYVWSVHIRDKNCPACFTNGKGASRDAALASALGEYFERLACNYFFADFHLGKAIANSEFVHYPNEKWFAITDDTRPEGLMNAPLWKHYDPDGDLDLNTLVDIQSGNTDRGICALPFTRQSNGELTYIPMNIVGNLFVSNGMSAGNTKTEARTQALSECFERFVKNKIIAEAISLPEIPADVIARFPTVVASIEELEKQGFPITCFDASLGGEYPVICVTLFNPENGGCFASFGAHPRFEIALERTVTELLQGRSLKDLDIFPSPSFDNDEVADHTNLETHFIDSSGLISWDLFKTTPDFAFNDWNFQGSTEEEYTQLLNKFHALGADVYIADYAHLGTYACRVLVPGYSEIYPVYELSWVNNNRAMALRELIQQWINDSQNVALSQEIIDVIDALDLDEFQPVDQLLGLGVDANSPWATLRIGELRCLLALATNDLETAFDWAMWTTDFNAGGISPAQQKRLRFYHAVKAIITVLMEGDDLQEYEAKLIRMYTQLDYQAAKAHVMGESQGYDLVNINDLLGFNKHQSLLAAYDKLQQAKAKFTQWS
ncbi:30S ribosomal protein S12 methylthiotransferase accessory factor YcaO [uncultured Shewanella sp.]|uniref:30S ribosomal protein S12 methylthiotransferase accessory factor YcaO n=1 Tax=uncultured Shewanella sp. TaxID=173975 RepID=UPI0026262B03|nr:30S ribosomal protein S12 methylthiotransferase accessory factor YcaO [uncultured Shewanella sp.]